jgi:hypothetical protein
MHVPPHLQHTLGISGLRRLNRHGLDLGIQVRCDQPDGLHRPTTMGQAEHASGIQSLLDRPSSHVALNTGRRVN